MYVSPSVLCPLLLVRDKSRCFESVNLSHPSPFSFDTLPVFLHLSSLIPSTHSLYIQFSRLRIVDMNARERNAFDFIDDYFAWNKRHVLVILKIAELLRLPPSCVSFSRLIDPNRLGLCSDFFIYPALIILSYSIIALSLFFFLCRKAMV